MTAARKLNTCPDIFTYHDYRAFLRDWFDYLKKSEPGFSLRGLAKLAGLSSAYMPMVMSGRRRLSEESLNRIMPFVKLDPSQKSYLRLLCQFSDSSSQEESLRALERAQRFQLYKEMNPKETETCSYLSHWHNIVIRELAALPNFQDNAEWVQKKMSFHVPIGEIEKALTFLKAFKFIQKEEGGRYSLPRKQIDCVGDVYRVLLGQFHKKMFQLGARAIEEVEREERDISGLTFSLSKKGYEEVKKLMENTMSELEKIAERETEAERVYHVTLAAFPLTKKGEGEDQ
ncbi:MAG: TIGR02147 family protein [Bdellovibrionia bacterium]